MAYVESLRKELIIFENFSRIVHVVSSVMYFRKKRILKIKNISVGKDLVTGMCNES
jgi:hypothetical protein